MKTQKWVDLALGAIAFVLFFLLREALIGLWDMAHWRELSSVLQWWDILAFVGALAAFVATRSQKRVQEFGNDVVLELSKVTWPARHETVMSSGVVIVMIGIASLLLFLVDLLWGSLSRTLIG